MILSLYFLTSLIVLLKMVVPSLFLLLLLTRQFLDQIAKSPHFSLQLGTLTLVVIDFLHLSLAIC